MDEPDDIKEISQAMAAVLASLSAGAYRVAAAAIAQLPESRRDRITTALDAGRCELTAQVSLPGKQVDVLANVKGGWLQPEHLSAGMELTDALSQALERFGSGAFQLVDLALAELLPVHRAQLEALLASGQAALCVQRDVLGGEVRVLVDGEPLEGPEVLFQTRWLEQLGGDAA